MATPKSQPKPGQSPTERVSKNATEKPGEVTVVGRSDGNPGAQRDPETVKQEETNVPNPGTSYPG